DIFGKTSFGGMLMIAVSKVVVSVADQDRAKDFWTSLGYRVVQDAPYGAERWLEVRSSDNDVTLVLELQAGDRPESVPDHLATSTLLFECNDVLEAHHAMVSAGVKFPQPPVHQPFGWWAMFSDGEGNRFALGQRGE